MPALQSTNKLHRDRKSKLRAIVEPQLATTLKGEWTEAAKSVKKSALEEHEEWLRIRCHTQSGPYLRPFTPNPCWQKSRVFIVGLSPVTALRDEFESFDHYWHCVVKATKEYENIALGRYLKPEEARSRTSKRLREFSGYLQPARVLVTNISAYPAVDPRLVVRFERQTHDEYSIIIRLLHICRPKVVFFHGREARRFANKYFDVDLDPYLPPDKQIVTAKIANVGDRTHLFAYHHLVGRVDKGPTVTRQLKKFAQVIKSLLGSGEETRRSLARKSAGPSAASRRSLLFESSDRR